MAQTHQLKKDQSPEVAHFLLHTGDRIPALGLGTWKAEPNVVRDAVFSAIVESGYRHIDCAHIYGNEEEVGQGLDAAFDAGIKRQDLFVTSKLWITDTSPEKVRGACERTLNDLKLKYLDLYLIHWPLLLSETASSPPKQGDIKQFNLGGVWQAMEGLVREKLVRNIGVSNFTVPKLEELMKVASIMPSVNQVEMHPNWRNDSVLEYCKKNKIHVTAYSPLGSSATDLFDEPIVNESPGQVLIRCLIQRGVSTVPKSSNDKRIEENMEVFNWSIPEEEVHKLSSLQTQIRSNPGTELIVGSKDEEKKVLEAFWDGEI